MSKKSVIQVFESGTVKVRGKEKQLRLVFRLDPIKGKILSVQRSATLSKNVPSHKIKRREYYEWVRRYLPHQPMTEEERRKSHIEAVQRHRKKARNV